MIVVDTSALMAIIQDEPGAAPCIKLLETETEPLISAGTYAEALIVAASRGFGDEMVALISGLNLDIVPMTAGAARHIADAYSRWGKGFHPARLNLGDCFAYGLATERNCRLLFVGSDFSKTDVLPAL